MCFRATEGPSTFPLWTNEMNHIIFVPPEDWIVVTDEVASGHCHVLRSEQNDAVGTKDVIQKSTSPGQTIIDPCGCIFATTKAYAFLYTHRRFVGSLDLLHQSRRINTSDCGRV